MKKVLYILVTLLIILTGCVSTSLPEQEGDTPTEEETDIPIEPYEYEVVLLNLSSGDAKNVTFEDTSLETAVRKEVCKFDGTLTNKDIETILVLEAHSMNITSLKGLEYCTNLRNVGLSSNRIRDVSPLRNLPGCTINVYNEKDQLLYTYSTLSLSLSHNEITDISSLGDYSSVDKLTIRLSNNQVGNITPLTGLTNLIALSLNRNGISDITPLAGMTQLSQLDLWGNAISDISVLAELTALTWLELEQNHVSNITPISSLPVLRRAILSHNQISTVPDLSGMASLEYIDLSYNQITDTSFLNTLPESVEVNLEGNPLG